MWHLQGGETGHAKRLPLSAQHRHAWLWGPVPHIWSGTGRPCGDDEHRHHKLSILYKRHLEVSLTTIRTPDYGVELLPCCALVGFDANSLYPWAGARHGHRGLPCQEWAGLWPGCWGHVPRLWSVAQQGFPPMAGLWGRSPQAGGPLACRQRAQGVTGPAPPTHGWLSSGHYHSVPVPLLLVSLSRLSWVWGHLALHYCRGEAGVQWKGRRLLEDHLWLHTHDHLGVRAGVPQADPSAAAVASGWVGTVGGRVSNAQFPSGSRWGQYPGASAGNTWGPHLWPGPGGYPYTWGVEGQVPLWGNSYDHSSYDHTRWRTSATVSSGRAWLWHLHATETHIICTQYRYVFFFVRDQGKHPITL